MSAGGPVAQGGAPHPAQEVEALALAEAGCQAVRLSMEIRR